MHRGHPFWGTKKQRLEGDSQRFDQCQLCLSAFNEPVASPYGFLYCRECILENFVAQKASLTSASAAYSSAQEKKEMDAAAAQFEAEAHATESFARAEGAVGASLGGTSKVPEAAGRAGMKRERMDMRDHRAKVCDALRSSPWMPAAHTQAAATALAPGGGPGDTRCPTAGKPLKAKELITVHLTPVESGASSGGSGSVDTQRWQCPACLKPIVYQKTILLAGCGHVTCADCCAKFVVPTKACYVCTRRIAGKSEVIPLQTGGSSYSAGEGTQAMAEKYKPSLMA
jgi:nitric oxide synthase-interacting protein